MIDAGLAQVDAAAAQGSLEGQALAFEQVHQVLVAALSTVEKA